MSIQNLSPKPPSSPSSLPGCLGCLGRSLSRALTSSVGEVTSTLSTEHQGSQVPLVPRPPHPCMICRTAPNLQEPWKVKGRGTGSAPFWMGGPHWGLASPAPVQLRVLPVCQDVCVCVHACLLTACLSSYTTSIKRFINLSIKAHSSPALMLCPPTAHMYVCSCALCHAGATWHGPASPYTNVAPVASTGNPKHSGLTRKGLGPSTPHV